MGGGVLKVHPMNANYVFNEFRHCPANLFKSFIKPRLKGEFVPEDVRPPQFAQAVGFVFGAIAVAGLLSGVTVVFTIATGFALAAAFLNATFNYCLGCEFYLILLRARR